MQRITCTVTSKGQVTIPKQVRDRLGISSGDAVTFVVHDSGTVEIRPVRYRMRDLRGILPGRETEDFDDLFEEAMQVRTDRLMTGTME